MSIPSSKWFPSSLQDRAAWYTNFNTNIQIVGASLGLTAGELTSIAHDWETFDYIANAAVTVDSYTDAIRNYRKVVTEGDVGDPTPGFPADISFSLPFAIATGLFERLDGYVKRIRVAPSYTDETGALLGITPSASGGASKGGDETTAPTIDATVSPGNVVNVKFVRGSSDGVLVQTQLDNEARWDDSGRFFKSPAVLAIPENADVLPRNVQIRARFLDGNNPVGDWSDVVTVQTIP